MSCRVYEPDSDRAAPVPWKHISPGEPVPQGEPPAADASSRLEELRRDYETKVQEAHAAGLREGEAAGRKSAAADLQPVLENFSRTIGELGRLRARLRREAEADTLKLALAIARRVLRRELAVDPNALDALLLGALERLRGQEVSRVKVHPSHAGPVSECLARAFPGAPVEVVSDSSLAPGSAIFETERGNLDASVETQLQEIERGLADRLRSQP